MREIKLGMVGVGNFGAARRALIRQAGGFRIIACADHSASMLERACQEEGAVACQSVDDLLNYPGVEGVVISTGATSHCEIAEATMAAGKHVFVEKPLCCSSNEVIRLRRAACKSGRVIGVGHHQSASDPIVVLVKRVIEDGLLGKIAAYEKNASHSGGFAIRKGDWRGGAEANPGGMLFQCGVHAFHMLHAIFGPIAEVNAAFRYDVNPDTETADVAAVTIRHEGGLVGTLNCYHVTAYCHELRIFGTKGNLYIDTFERRAWYQKALYGPREPRVEIPVEPSSASEVANLESWRNAILSGGVPDPGLEEGIAAVLPVFAADRAASTGRSVSLADVASTVASCDNPPTRPTVAWINPTRRSSVAVAE